MQNGTGPCGSIALKRSVINYWGDLKFISGIDKTNMLQKVIEKTMNRNWIKRQIPLFKPKREITKYYK